ncbi:hypothetical protein C8R45DRAFT_1081926 [Mycena sanguinolenta]|nr:hypothetical protein C8R45DRAFT_1081926 [Mycena sanguinolenta]
MQPETWNGSWYLAALSLRYTPTTTYASPPGQGSPYSYGDQAYGYGGNYSGMYQRMHTFPQASSPPPSVLGSAPAPPSRKKKEAHTTAVMNLPAEKRAQPALHNPKKQRKYEDEEEDEDDSDCEDVASVDSDSDDEEDWRERERRKWGKVPTPVADVVPPGAAEFQNSVRTTPHDGHPFHPLHIPVDDPPPVIEFKRKGALTAGINLAGAQATWTTLAGNDLYTLQDLHADQRGRIHVRVRWAGYSPLTYNVPLDVVNGHVSMEALLRRVARACVDYLKSNMYPGMYSRVQLHHLEEIEHGVWQPMLHILF